MSCFRPNVIYFDTSKEPRKILKFYSGNKKSNPLNYEWFNEQNQRFRQYNLNLEYVQVPCGQCEGCQEAYSKEWAIRCLLESYTHEHNYFLTLTYDDEHLPIAEYMVDKDTGEIYEDEDGLWQYLGGTLQPRDMDLFLKKLRKFYEYENKKTGYYLGYKHTGTRFYYCGEYGEISGRAHYHMLTFNMPIKPEDLKVYRINTDGSIYYTCEWLTKMWNKGYVVIGEINWDTCAYTARYVMKKLKHMPKEEYYKLGKIPEFVRMSRRPGIAREAYKEAYFENDEIIYKGHRENITSAKPPRYFDKIYDIENHEEMDKIKNRRKALAEASQRVEMSKTSLNIRDHLRMKQTKAHDVWKSLKRNKI